MSDTKTPASLPRLLSDDAIAKVMADQFKTQRDHVVACGAARSVRNIYEADQAKTREVVQAMVNDMQDFVDKVDRGEAKSKRSYAAFKHRIEVAKSQLNIEPTKP